MRGSSKKQLSQRFFVALSTLFSAVASLTISSAHAFSLGALEIDSSPGQALSARIPVVVDENDDSSSLRVSVATSAQYAQQGLSRAGIDQGIRVSLVNMSDGARYILLRSDQPVNADQIDVLLNVKDQNHTGLRRFIINQNVNAKTSEELPTRLSSAKSKSDTGVADAQSEKNNATQITSVQRAGQSITVMRGQTLGGIARSLKPSDVDTKQMLLALQKANPHAFIRGNMNLVKAGAVLTLPSDEAVRKVSLKQARQAYREQTQAFREGRVGVRRALTPPAESQPRQTAGRVAPPTPASPELRSTPSRDPALPDPVSDQDRLELSGDSSALDQSAEELVAKTKALAETESRVQELEQNVQAMQKLLEKQNAAMLKSQQNAKELQTKLADRSFFGFLENQHLLIYFWIAVGILLSALGLFFGLWIVAARKAKRSLSLLAVAQAAAKNRPAELASENHSSSDVESDVEVMHSKVLEPIVSEVEVNLDSNNEPTEDIVELTDVMSTESVSATLSSETVSDEAVLPTITTPNTEADLDQREKSLVQNLMQASASTSSHTSPESEIPSTSDDNTLMKAEQDIDSMDVIPSLNETLALSEETATIVKPLDVDFDLDLSSSPSATTHEATEEVLQVASQGTPLEPEKSPIDAKVRVDTDLDTAVADVDTLDPIAEMFDLVSAYVAIDDKVSAKELLREILEKGNAEQQLRAHEILADLAL